MSSNNNPNSSEPPRRLNLTIRLTSGRRFTPNPPPLGITTHTTVSVFKSLVSATMARHAARSATNSTSSTSSDEAVVPIQPIPPARQRLVYRGKILSDGTKTLGDYGVEDGGLIYLVKGSGSGDEGNNGGGSGGAVGAAGGGCE